MDNFNIKPPSNFTCLTDVATSKYDLKVIHFSYTNDNGHSVLIKNDLDYANFLISTSDSGQKEIEILVKDEEDISNKHKKQSLRKHSTTGAFNSNLNEEDGLNDMMNDYDLFGDTRNRKAMMSEGQWSNQCTGVRENRRIEYIKEKKDKQREEQRRRDGMNECRKVDAENDWKCNKRKLKCRNGDEDDMNMDVDRGDNKKGKGKGKKKKK